MPERTPYSAVRALEAVFQRCASCITDDKALVSRGGYEPTRPALLPHTLTLAHDPAQLASAEGLLFSATVHYRVLGERERALWRADSAAYYFEFRDLELRELLAYHWHPAELRAADAPHLHLGHGAVDTGVLDRASLSRSHNGLRRDLARAHLPTHRLTVDGAVRLAIEQLGVRPRRSDWDRVLREAHSFFEREQDWL